MKTKKIYYNKLIRDKIPERIKEAGGDYLCRKLNKKEFVLELAKKIGEESDGLVNAKNRKGFIEELGDVIDVIEELKKAVKVKPSEISKVRKNAQMKKGGFDKRLFLVWSSDTGYKSNERRYLRKK